MRTGAWLQDGVPGRWLVFGPPREVFVAHRVDRVAATLEQVCRRVEATGRWAAGFVAYEAAPAFSPALAAHPPAAHPGAPPLLVFTLHDPPRRLPEEAPAGADPAADLPSPDHENAHGQGTSQGATLFPEVPGAPPPEGATLFPERSEDGRPAGASARGATLFPEAGGGVAPEGATLFREAGGGPVGGGFSGGASAYRLGPWRPSVDEATYRRRVTEVRRRIARGDTYQVNYTYRLRATFAGDPRAFFHDLAAAQRGGYGGYFEIGELAVCSASPELFFELAEGVVTTRPMKGTAPRGRWPEEDRRNATALAASEKERAENLMIVDMMRNDLGRVAEPGSVRVPELFTVERYPTVWQITSTVTARLAVRPDPAGPVPRIFAALFPCASITGAPKVSTSAIIRELEDGPRGVYTGALGWIAPGGRARFGVAIRTAVVDRRRGAVEYGVGGGIVWDSRPAREAAESRLKARVLPVGPTVEAEDAAPGRAAVPPSAGGGAGRLPVGRVAHRPPFELLETLLWTPEEGIWLVDEHLDRLEASAVYFGWADSGRAAATADPELRAAALRALEAAVAQAREPGAAEIRQPPAVPLPGSRPGAGVVPPSEGAPRPGAPSAAPPPGPPPTALRLRLLVRPDGGLRVQATPLALRDLGARRREDAADLPAVPVALAAAPVDAQDVFLFHKTTHRTVYERALARRPEGAEEVLLWNRRRELTEAATANLVVALDGRLLTPAVHSGLLGGTFRRRLLAAGEVEEGVVRLADLARRDGLWLVNSVRRWRRARLLP